MKNKDSEVKIRKPFYKKWWFWTIVAVIILGALFGGDDTKEEDVVKENNIESTYEMQSEIPVAETVTEKPEKNSKKQEEQQKKDEPEEVKTQKYNTKITAGYYVGGIQLPSGKYNITLVSGTGNVFSDSGLNEIFSTDSSFGIDKYNNFELGYGDTLNITGNLKLKMECKEADMDSLTELDNADAKKTELATGKYVAGEDFPAGIYDIIHTQGNGNVFVDDGMTVNEMVGSDDEMYIQEFKNCTFKEGTTIELSGVSVKLVPSKCSLQK